MKGGSLKHLHSPEYVVLLLLLNFFLGRVFILSPYLFRGCVEREGKLHCWHGVFCSMSRAHSERRLQLVWAYVIHSVHFLVRAICASVALRKEPDRCSEYEIAASSCSVVQCLIANKVFLPLKCEHFLLQLKPFFFFLSTLKAVNRLLAFFFSAAFYVFDYCRYTSL